MAQQDKKDCVVFRTPRYDPEEAYSPNFRPPEPVVEFTGTEAECKAYMERRISDHDYANPGMFDAPRPNLER